MGLLQAISIQIRIDLYILTRAREWGPELRALERGGGRICPPANSAPMNVRITKCLWEVGWLMISIMCNFGDPRLITWGIKNRFQKKS